MKLKKKIWAEHNGCFYLTTPSVEHEELRNIVYTVNLNAQTGQFYLTEVCESFTFDYKLYGLETKLINRVIKTYRTTNSGNLGLLLNGVKGTGKTVSSKILANSLNQPTIVVSKAYDGVQYFLNSIPQNITIFIDEYEKIYGTSNDMLTIMDGAMNSQYRRMFLLTTNKLHIEDNLKERPSRLRYIKKFEDLSPSVVEEIIDDILLYPEFKDECMKFMTGLSLITVDIVKAIINEVNIHNESPFEFGDVFNVSKIDGKYKIYELDENGKDLGMLADNAKVYPRPEYNIDEHSNYWFEINGKSIGIVDEILGPDTISVNIITEDENGEPNVTDNMIFKVIKSYGTHNNYAWGVGGSNANDLQTNDKLSKLMNLDPKKNKKKSISIKFEKIASDITMPDITMPMSENGSIGESLIVGG